MASGVTVLRWLAALLIRGPDATYIRAELDDAFERDRERGIGTVRAHWRYVANVMGSATSLIRSRRSSRSVTSRRRGRFRFGFSWLDVKLGLRMIVKQPGLTAVAVFALAIGIPVGLAPEFLVDAIEAPLPAPDGDRIKLLRYWDTASGNPGTTTSYDLDRWRASLGSFEMLGAHRSVAYNVDTDAEGRSVLAMSAEVTASVFEMLRARPLLGRALTAEDEAIGAPSVVVVGYDFWQVRMAADPDVLGRTLRLGGVPYTVVGVMPAGFRFPSIHQLWVPLRSRPTAEPAAGRPLAILGRLADGVSASQAEAELGTVTRAMAVEFPETHERLVGEVVPTAHMVFGLPKGGMRGMPEFWIIQALTLLLLVVACTNVGLLIYARSATRASEMAVRTALGATRTRIVTQVFTESLVLAAVSAGLGLLLIDRVTGILPGQIARLLAGSAANSANASFLPYWVDPGVKVSTVAWALGLAVFSAVVAGVVPALRITGRSVQRSIQRARAGLSGVRFGGVTSALMVFDVALAVAAVGMAGGVTQALREAWAGHADLVGFPAEEYVSARFLMQWTEPPTGTTEADRSAFATRLALTQQALVERLEAEPGVRGVAVATVLPRMNHPNRMIEVEGESRGDFVGHVVKTADVGIGFFDALERPVLSGRGFNTADVRVDGSSVVIVNTSFVDRVLRGGNPMGRRIRFTNFQGGDPGPWLEIVGVADRLGMDIMSADNDDGVYRPLALGSTAAIYLAIHVGANPESFVPRLRAIVREVDDNALIGAVSALNDVYEGDWYIMAAVGLGAALLVGILLALASSGIFAMMSFNVAQRTREIGIRSALGAGRMGIVQIVAKRAVIQLGLGVLIGLPVGVRLFMAMTQTGFTVSTALLSLVPGIGILLVVGFAACTAPTLRALRVNPTEALNSGR